MISKYTISKTIGAFAVIATLSSCVSVYPAGDLVLNEGEGYVVTAADCGHYISGLFVYPTGASSDWAPFNQEDSITAISCNNYTKQPKVFKLPVGDYYIGRVWGKSDSSIGYTEDKSLKFSVAENKINYIGFLKVGTRAENTSALVTRINVGSIKVTDHSEQEAKGKLKISHPQIVENFAWKKGLASY